MLRIILVAALLLPASLFSQVDPRKLDSLEHSIEEQTQSIQEWQDSFQHRQDSLYNAGISNTERRIRQLVSILEEKREQEARKEKSAYLRIAIGALLLAVIVFGILRRRTK